MGKNVSIFFVYVLLVCIIGALAYLYKKTITLENHVQSLSYPYNSATTTSSSTQSNTNIGNEETSIYEFQNDEIPSAILFETTSSPLLSPQAPIVVTIESIVPHTDTLDVHIKAFTSKASSYTALEIPNLITLVQDDGTILKSHTTSTLWKSMPPKSFVTGTLSFPFSEDKTTATLRIDTGTEVTLYRFDLTKKTYREIVQ